MIERNLVLNAFLPSTEIDDPDRFAGRAEQVRTLADALSVRGAVPLIYGDRGLGKSSLALQARLIAMGSMDLLHNLGAERLAIPEDRQYLTFYVTCTDSTKTIVDLLQALVNAAESIDNASGAEERAGATHLIDRTTRRRLSFKLVEFESTSKYETERQRLSYQDLNLEEKLVQLCELLSATYGQRVLFVIDELDRMASTEGLASFLKAASSENLKFMLVGIASNVSTLLNDHQSLERRLVPVKVPLMTEVELGQIVVKAVNYLSEHGHAVNFNHEAILRLARVASGFPWFVHVIGQQCLSDADHEGRAVVGEKHVLQAIEKIADNRMAQQFSDMYQKAVRDSEPREKTLRAFAHWTDPDIPTGELYRILNGKLGVAAGSTYRGHLVRPEYGDVLMVTAIQKRGLVRFRNEMFKAYVRMRPSIYQGVDVEVRNAFS